MRNLIGSRVRSFRGNQTPRLTQEALARRLQLAGLRLDRVAVSKIELGYREVTDIELAAIAKALGVSAAWLIGETDESATPGTVRK